MRKNIFIALFLGLSAFFSNAQSQGDGGKPHAVNSFIAALSPHSFMQPNIKALRAEDVENEAKGSGPWRFGYANDVELNMLNTGQWFDLPDGGKVWLFKAHCDKALSINFILKDIQLTEGNELYIYNPSLTTTLGKFTAHHLYQGRLGSELIQGSDAIIEYYLAPGNSMELASLTIERIVHGYRTTEEFSAKAFGNAGACEMNVNCPDGASWSQQKRSAVMLVNSGGTGFCSGALVNNVLNDGKPYILTANHCYSDPTTWVFRFNWESADCTNPANEPSYSSLSGAVLRARRTTSDFCLVEITGGLESGTIPASYNAFFAGWDNSGANPSSTVCIHHPKGDIKKISFDDNATYPVQSSVNSVLSDVDGSWEIQWDRNTTTESASSGSPLFDQNHRIIGQLWGGAASCGNLTGNDYFGRFHNSWEPEGSNSTNQLKYWLNPTSINALVIDGFDPSIALVNLDASLIIPSNVNGTYCDGNVSPQVRILNLGVTTITAVTIHYGFDGMENQTYNWTGNLAQYGSEIVNLDPAFLTAGPHTFSASSDLPNGGNDQNPMNNSVNSSFYIVLGGEDVTLNLMLDCYASETSWEIKDQNDIVLYKSSGYSNDTEGLVSYTFCLAQECYSFSIYDKYGDGMSGCSSGDGSFQILNANSVVIAELLEANANFGSSYIKPVCLGSSGIIEVNDLNLKLYPNPAQSIVNIQSTDHSIDAIELVTITGQIMIQQEVQASSFVMDVSNVATGIYLLKVKSQGITSIVRLVVE